MQLQKSEKTNQPKNQKPREKAGDAFSSLSLDILPFLCLGGGMWQWVPWARHICVSKNRRECAVGCCPLAGPGTPFSFSWSFTCVAGMARRFAGVYGLANWREPRFTWSLAVWNRSHEAFSCAGGRRAVISKQGGRARSWGQQPSQLSLLNPSASLSVSTLQERQKQNWVSKHCGAHIYFITLKYFPLMGLVSLNFPYRKSIC